MRLTDEFLDISYEIDYPKRIFKLGLCDSRVKDV